VLTSAPASANHNFSELAFISPAKEGPSARRLTISSYSTVDRLLSVPQIIFAFLRFCARLTDKKVGSNPLQLRFEPFIYLGDFMLWENLAVQERLRAIIQRLTADVHLRDDLYQEGVLWLRRTEAAESNHTRSWYLNGCKNFLIDFLRLGCSVDAPKRRHLCGPPPGPGEGAGWTPEGLVAKECVLDAVSVADLVAQVAAHLRPVERWVLEALAEGSGEGEIAQALHVTRQAVAKYRKKIAAACIHLAE
jgi:DNA-directed RNA polymerase specialized sigma24 family protein